MRLPSGNTPRHEALDIAMGWLKNVYDGGTNDLMYRTASNSQMVALRRAIAALHNRLLSQFDGDGIPLDEEVSK